MTGSIVGEPERGGGEGERALGVWALLRVGLAGGAWLGSLLGLLEGGLIWTLEEREISPAVFPWAVLAGAAQGILLASFAALVGAALARGGARRGGRARHDPRALFAGLGAALLGLSAFALLSYRGALYLFEGELSRSPLGTSALLLGAGIASAGIALLVARRLRGALDPARARLPLLLRPWPAAAASALLFLSSLALAAALGIGRGAPAPAREGAGRAREGAPNVLLVVVDTLSADRLSAYGHRGGRTPALDRFARDAVRFEEVYANSSWTRPTFASLYTGRLPASHGVMGKGDALPGALTTLAEALHAEGYATAGLMTNFNVAAHFHFDQGFDTYRYLEPTSFGGARGRGVRTALGPLGRSLGLDPRPLAELLAARVAYRLLSPLSPPDPERVPPGTLYCDAEELTGEALQWLGSPPAEPWMLTLGYMDPHSPYFPHDLPDGEREGESARIWIEPPEASEAPAIADLYEGEIRYWDRHFGALIEGLRRRGLYERTLIVVTADHGEELGEHGRFGHGTSLYREVVHVPLLFKLPGGERGGTVVQAPVEPIDLMPTLLDELGLAIPEGVQGRSLFTETQGPREILAEEEFEGHTLASLRADLEGEPWLLITANEGNPRGLAEVELYRLREDPRQERNLAEAEPERTELLLQRLREARQRAASGASAPSSVALDEDARERLRQLGYIFD